MKTKNIIKKIYNFIFPILVKKKIDMIRYFFGDKERYNLELHWSKKKIKLGRLNKEKKIYILRRHPIGAGLLTTYLTHLVNLEKIHKKFYPVIDMKTYYFPMIHNSEKDVGNINAWEMFFKPLSQISVEEAYLSKNVTLGSGYMSENGKKIRKSSSLSKREIMRWHNLDKKYMILREELISKYSKDFERIISNKRVIGVSIREAFEKISVFNNKGIIDHPVQPKTNSFINDIMKYLIEWNCDYIFVSTESNQTLEIMTEVFRDKVIYLNRVRRDMNANNLIDYINDTNSAYSKTNNQERSIDYLEEVYFLSRCTCLLGGKSSSIITARIWNGCKYENEIIYNLGVY